MVSSLDETGTIHPTRAYAIRTLFYLASREKCRMRTERIGAIPPLLEIICDYSENKSYLERRTAAVALFYLTDSSRDNLAHLAKMEAVPKLMAIVGNPIQCYELRLNGMKLLRNLSRDERAMQDLISGGAVRLTVGLVREGQGMDKYCLDVLYSLCSHHPEVFIKQAREAGAEAVLAAAPKEEWKAYERETAETLMFRIDFGE